MAVMSWAQTPVRMGANLLPEQFATKAAKMTKHTLEKKERTPHQLLKAPAQQAKVKWAKRNPENLINLNPPAILTGSGPTTYIVKNYAFTETNYGTSEEPDIQLEPAAMERFTESWTITPTDDAANTVEIIGIDNGYETVTATIDATANTITIPCRQKAAVTEYGDVYLFNYTGKENLVGTITSEGIVFADLWYTAFIDGEYAGWAYSDLNSSMAVLPNGTMSTQNYNPREGGYWTKENDVAIDFNEENFTATIWNFYDFHAAIDVQLKDGGKFVIEPQIVETDAFGMESYYTTGINYTTTPVKITGVGTESTLVFATQWTCFSPYTKYAYDTYNPATINYDGTFVYPVLEEVPATPMNPEFVFFSHWTEDARYATATVNIYPYDNKGNELITRLLTFELYTKDENGNPVSLGTPYAYDNADNGDTEKKTVTLGAQAKDLTIIGVKSIYTAKGTANESDIIWFEIPQLTAVPDGLEMKEYPTTSEAHDDSYYNYTSERFSKVAIDGTDIYIQGLLPQCPYGWAKGVISGTTVTIPRMQCQGCSDGEYVFLTSFDIESMEFKDLVFEYNADEDIYMTYDMLIGNTNTEELSILPPYLSGMTIGTEKIPELAQLPEGAEVKEYPFVGQHVVDGYALEFERTVNVAVVDNDVYLQGLNSVVPDAWVKGTNVGDGIVIFPTGQNFGVDETKDLDGNVFFTQQYFFVGGNYQTGKIEDVIMIYNAEKNYYELQNELMVSNKKSTIEIVEWYLHGTTIGQKEESNLPPLMTITVPEDFQREIWTLEAPEMIYEEENFTAQVYKTHCDAGFYTADEADGTYFFIQGLCPEKPEVWIKAPLKDGKVVIPASTYFGDTYLSDPETYEYFIVQLFLTSTNSTADALTDVVFNYDEEKGQLVSTQPILINANRRKLAYLHIYAGMTITRIPDVAATPVDPEIPAEGGLDVVDTWSPKIHAVIKPYDVNGNELLGDKLTYSVWIEKDGENQQLVFTPSDYWGLDGETIEIPYYFNNWDITTGGETITLFKSEDEIKTWKKIGVQSIYYGGGERNVSNIIWAENPAYDGDETGIANIGKDSQAPKVYFNLQGHRVTAPAKGLYIVNGKKVVIK